MKNKVLFFLIVLYAVSGMYALAPEDEYDYLYTDLMNFYTYGYKKTFDERIMKSNGKINFAQGSLTVTGNKTDIAIQGNGFLKFWIPKGMTIIRAAVIFFGIRILSWSLNVRTLYTIFLPNRFPPPLLQSR